MKEGQVFGIPTYDALFKWVLSSDSVRPSFFHAFIPFVNVQSSVRLDDHMSPHQELQILRNLIHDTETETLVDALQEGTDKLKVHFDDNYHEDATKFLKALLHNFEDIRFSFPKARYDGTMDFVCKLSSGEYALVEMQITPSSHWDQRALAYVAALYCRQLRRKTPWKDIRKVIGLNILGGGKNDEKHWEDFPDHYMRHYKFQEQVNGETPPRFLEGIEIIQYSLVNAPEMNDSREQKDWLLFLRNAQNMTQEEVNKEIKTPAVLEAFELAKLDKLPSSVKDNYEEQDANYANYSDHVEKKEKAAEARGIAIGEAIGEEKGKAKGKAEGKSERNIEIAINMLKHGIEISVIQVSTGLSREEVIKLQEKLLKMKAIILAAGKGSRLGDKNIPKPLTSLYNGMTILEYQINQLLHYLSIDDIFIVVGHCKELIMEAFPDAGFVYSPNYANENTSQSLLRGISKIQDDLLWLNGDVVFHPSVLEKIMQTKKNVMLVNQGPVGEEEVKYTCDASGKILEVSKNVKNPEGEALGINLFQANSLATLRKHLKACAKRDYFEKAIELGVKEGLDVWALPVGPDDCTEIDFPEDLDRANYLINKWTL